MRTRDFNENPALIIKYGVFTLVYSCLLAQLSEFKQALSPQTGLSLEQISSGIDQVVSKLLREGQPASLVEATQRLAAGLQYERDLKADRVPALAHLYDALVEGIRVAAATWDYRQDVARWHDLGRDLARRFYVASPHQATQDCLTREAQPHFEWTRDALQAPFGYREDHLRVAESPVAGIITVRFSFSHERADGLAIYLAYPFYFMHEYVSHVYTVSAGSDVFTDGWLLFAAQRFLRRFNAYADEPPLQSEQVDVVDHILPQSGVGYRGYVLARRFQPWAEVVAPTCFEQLTFHLAASLDTGGLSHTRFLWTLEQELTKARPRLRARLRAGGCRPESVL